MMDQFALLRDGSKRIGELRTKYPENAAIKSVQLQIEYLIEIVADPEKDRSRLREIIIGLLTAREIEPLDEDGSEVFYQIASLAKHL